MIKLNFKGYKGFVLLRNDYSSEANKLKIFCLKNDINLIYINKKDKLIGSYIPCGSVEFCESILGYHVKPDYYPKWLKKYLYRKVWNENKWILGKKLFVKPADKYKRFTGFKTFGTYSKKKKPPLIWSEIIEFKNEWRYYITKGKVICGEWYWGDEVNMPKAPELDIKIPNWFCGAVDFGITTNNKFALIESQHPFACGWYGSQENDSLYFQWLIDGWIYTQNEENYKKFRELFYW